MRNKIKNLSINEIIKSYTGDDLYISIASTVDEFTTMKYKFDDMNKSYTINMDRHINTNLFNYVRRNDY